MYQEKIQDKIYQKLQTLSPSFLEIQNESSQHKGNREESHFKVIIISKMFNEKSLMERHRLIYALLSDEMQTIHALSLHCYAPGEKAKVKHSPPCEGS